MSKASEYARIRKAAAESRTPHYKETGGSVNMASVTADATLYAGGIFADPLALARWIVETWGEEGPVCNADGLRYYADSKLRVSPTGEIKGTLPCGHGVESTFKCGHALACGACAARSPAP